MGRIVVVGDIGGQINVFKDILKRIGIGNDLTVPKGLIVIQVGDIIRMSNHLNLDSVACASLADKLLRKNPGKWIQLVGNHESPYIDGPMPDFWHQYGSLSSCGSIVSSWWGERLCRLAVAIDGSDGREYLLTHAGLTYGYMRRLSTANHVDSANALNSFVGGAEYGKNSRTGVIAFNGDKVFDADILWASSLEELYPSWLGKDMGFHQIHGHDIPFLDWFGSFRNPVPEEIASNIVADLDKRSVVTSLYSGWQFQTVDWVLKEYSGQVSDNWLLYELDGVIVSG